MKILTKGEFCVISGGIPVGMYTVGDIIILTVESDFQLDNLIFNKDSYKKMTQGGIIDGYQIIFMPNPPKTPIGTTYILTPIT